MWKIAPGDDVVVETEYGPVPMKVTRVFDLGFDAKPGLDHASVGVHTRAFASPRWYPTKTAATEAIIAGLKEENEEAFLADGFKVALVGIAAQFTRALACYSVPLCLKILMRRDRFTYDKAVDFCNSTVIEGWAGPNTPIFLHSLSDDDEPWEQRWQ